jgi:hypothetical protein
MTEKKVKFSFFQTRVKMKNFEITKQQISLYFDMKNETIKGKSIYKILPNQSKFTIKLNQINIIKTRVKSSLETIITSNNTSNNTNQVVNALGTNNTTVDTINGNTTDSTTDAINTKDCITGTTNTINTITTDNTIDNTIDNMTITDNTIDNMTITDNTIDNMTIKDNTIDNMTITETNNIKNGEIVIENESDAFEIEIEFLLNFDYFKSSKYPEKFPQIQLNSINGKNDWIPIWEDDEKYPIECFITIPDSYDDKKMICVASGDFIGRFDVMNGNVCFHYSIEIPISPCSLIIVVGCFEAMRFSHFKPLVKTEDVSIWIYLTIILLYYYI